MKREPGFYWVKLDGEWVVADYAQAVLLKHRLLDPGKLAGFLDPDHSAGWINLVVFGVHGRK